jgi:hypothetical protein
MPKSKPIKHLVLHVGAAKCASTSLQASLEQLSSIETGILQYRWVDPAFLWTRATPTHHQETATQYLDQLLDFDGPGTLILSQEFFSRVQPTLPSLRYLVDGALGSHGYSSVRIVCYTRTQSAYVKSAFGQWHFRCSQCISEDRQYLLDHGIDPELFTPYESCLIGIALRDRAPNWHVKLRWLKELADPSDPRFSVSSCHIPTSALPYELLQDFLERAGMIGLFDSVAVANASVRRNESFHALIIEAVSFLSSRPGEIVTLMPGEHQSNAFYEALSAVASANLPPQHHVFGASLVDDDICDLIDRRWRRDNHLYCQEYDVDPRYFGLTSLDASDDCLIDRDSVLDLVAREAVKRSPSLISEYREQCVSAFFKIMATLIRETWQ